MGPLNCSMICAHLICINFKVVCTNLYRRLKDPNRKIKLENLEPVFPHIPDGTIRNGWSGFNSSQAL